MSRRRSSSVPAPRPAFFNRSITIARTNFSHVDATNVHASAVTSIGAFTVGHKVRVTVTVRNCSSVIVVVFLLTLLLSSPVSVVTVLDPVVNGAKVLLEDLSALTLVDVIVFPVWIVPSSVVQNGAINVDGLTIVAGTADLDLLDDEISSEVTDVIDVVATSSGLDAIVVTVADFDLF